MKKRIKMMFLERKKEKKDSIFRGKGLSVPIPALSHLEFSDFVTLR